MVQYVSVERVKSGDLKRRFDEEKFRKDIPVVVNAMDNVIDNTNYPLAKQKLEAESKRRMGLGITGLGNTLTLIGLKYGSPEAVAFIKKIMRILSNTAYEASSDRSLDKGSFPLYDPDKYIESGYIKKLPI